MCISLIFPNQGIFFNSSRTLPPILYPVAIRPP
nr:MAG TPA: hypothetical protein [Caudoviricetes sp.]